MRLIYLLAADADAIAVSEIKELLEQRGYRVRRAEQNLAFPPARPQEITLAIWSRAVALSGKEIQFANRAIDAWAAGHLIFAQLDNSLLPRGLGDVEAIDLSYASGRVAAVWKIVEAAQDRQKAGPLPPDAYVEDDASIFSEVQAGTESAANVSISHALIIGLVAAAAFMSMGYIAMPQASHVLVAGAAAVWGILVGVVTGHLVARIEVARLGALPALPSAEANLPRGESEYDLAVAARGGVFVSCARRDGAAVYQMMAKLEASGRPVWIDMDPIESADRPSVTVRAMRESDTVCLMCTAEAFQSDTVRRDIFIAHKYRRKLLPVRLDFSEVPDDFKAFLMGRDWLDLTAVEPEERAARLSAALAR